MPEILIEQNETQFQNTKKLKEHLSKQIERAVETKKRFLKEFDEDPVYTLEWSKVVFEAVGTERVARTILYLLDKGATLQEIQKKVFDNLKNGAMLGWPSTSVPSNFMEQCKLMAWGKVADDMYWLGLIF